ncbi:MAG: hypothetical protein PUA93_01975 [Eubacteriales bacterium]|nr:hypothetical protein [Eubacteriales bacterium]
MKKQIVSIVVLSLAALGLAGCTRRGTNSSSASSNTPSTSVKDGIRVAYSIQDYNLVRAEVQVKDGKAASVRFDEYPVTNNYVALTTQTSGDNVISGDVTSYGKTSTAYRAKYLNVNGTVFTGTYANGAFTYSNGSNITDYDAWAKGLTSQKDLSDLYYAIANNFVYGCDKDGNKVDGLTANNLSKADYASTYWTFGKELDEGSRWKWNINKLEKALAGKDLDKVTLASVKNDKNVITDWTVDSTSIGATMSSMDAHLAIAKQAFDGTSKVVAYYNADALANRTSNGHKDCIAKVELVVGNDNKVVDAHINETVEFLDTFATTTTEPTYEHVSFEKTSHNKTSTVYVAKYMWLNGTVYTASAASSDKANYIYKNGDKEAYATIASDPYLSADFYNAAFTHHIRVAKDATASETYDANYANKTATKAEYGCTYWNTKTEGKTINGSQWKWNIDKVEKSFVNKDMSKATVAPITEKDPNTKKDKTVGWTLDSVTTGATMTEYETFATFAKNAYAYLA